MTKLIDFIMCIRKLFKRKKKRIYWGHYFVLLFCLSLMGCAETGNYAQSDNALYGEQNNPDNYKGWVIRRVLIEHVGFDHYYSEDNNLELQLTKGTIRGVSETYFGMPNYAFQWDCWYNAKTWAIIVRPYSEVKRWNEGDTLK